MNINPSKIKNVYTVLEEPFSDSRGAFSRIFCENELDEILGGRNIVQINHSLTRSVGAVRGMHYQNPPRAEMKLIKCLKGRVWDVAVDLRKDSPTFLDWHSVILSPESRNMLVVPEGCAHGFQVLKGDSELLYLHTAFYSPESEGAIRYDDPKIGISWPLPVSELSKRDESHLHISDAFQGIEL